MFPSLAETLKRLPASAGVYLFYGSGREPIYIGKAKNLRSRVRSYFQEGRTAGRGTKFGLREHVYRIHWEALPSDVAALIRESELIKRWQPRFNVLMRDDKNYFYVGFTRERFPRVFLTHQPVKGQRSGVKSQFVGPFTSGRMIKTALAALRGVFPYCTCKREHRGRCLSQNLGLCPGWCCTKGTEAGERQARKYREVIQRLRAVLKGRVKEVRRKLDEDMRRAARMQNFEEAARARDASRALKNILSHRPILEPRRDARSPARRLAELIGSKKVIRRIEGYDIANLGPSAASGAIVVFVGGKPVRSAYRKFRIKSVKGANDPAMLAEVLVRRMRHTEWALPDLVLLDGGRSQLSVVSSALASRHHPLPFALAALAKRSRSLYIQDRRDPVSLDTMPSEVAFGLERVRDEAHRFSRVYHHWMRGKELISE